MSAFTNLNWGTRKRNTGLNSGILFLIGGAISGIGAYLLLTEKGAATRKKITEKVKSFSLDNFTGLSKSCESQKEDMLSRDPNPEEQTPATKAHNMVSHLKHK